MTPPLHQRRRSKTDAYRETVRAWLLADEDAPRKQRHTAHRVYKRLVEEAAGQGFMLDVSERSIRNLVADLKRELLQQELVALPLLHPAGEAQVDFGEVTFYERGIRYEGHHLCLVLPHSDAKYTQLFKGQVFECLGQGLVDIFTHLGGVPPVIRFDNMSTAVKAIRALGERELTENFRRLQCHYGFTSNFCNPASGHEKGAVENYVGNSRRNLFVPMPEIEDLEAYNKELLATCDAHLEKVHYKLERLVGDLLKEDQARFIPLPADPFDACRYVPARTDNYGKAIFQTNKYSTAGHLRTTDVTLKLGAHHVTVLDAQMTAVVRHPRLYGQKKESMIWAPYLSVMAKRPNAFKYVPFFEELPPPLRTFLQACDLSGKQQILRFLAKESQRGDLALPIAHLTDALALKPGNPDALIAAYAFVSNRPGTASKSPVSSDLPVTPEYTLDLSVYGKLMGGAS